MDRHIVLVHGAAHTGECWELLRPELTRRGFSVHTPTLSGHRGNPRSPLAVTMRTYGEDVLAAVRKAGAPVILLGHSMGGFAVSQAAEVDPAGIDSMIYLTAYVPKPGRSTLSGVAPTNPALTKSSKFHLNGSVTIRPDAARTIFYNRCTRDVQDRAIELLSPQPIRSAASSIDVTEGGLGAIRKHYIECSDDNAIPLSSQREMQGHLRFDRIETLDTDHSPFYSTPVALAKAIDRMTAAAPGS